MFLISFLLFVKKEKAILVWECNGVKKWFLKLKFKFFWFEIKIEFL